MESFELKVQPRTDIGKSASRRLRRSGMVPGIVYGVGKEPVPFAVNHNDLHHHLEQEAFYSHILTLSLDNKVEKVVLKDVQRHPWKPAILHIDLLRIDEKAAIVMRVPLHYINEEKCVGVKTGGGVVSRIMTDIEIRCLPGDLPEYIEIDLLELEIGHTVHLGELQLPDKVENYSLLHGGDPMQPVLSVHLPRVVQIEEEVTDTQTEVEDTGEGDTAEKE